MLLLRYGDMRKTIGFRMRDMWYNLGESAAIKDSVFEVFDVSPLAVPQAPTR